MRKIKSNRLRIKYCTAFAAAHEFSIRMLNYRIARLERRMRINQAKINRSKFKVVRDEHP